MSMALQRAFEIEGKKEAFTVDEAAKTAPEKGEAENSGETPPPDGEKHNKTQCNGPKKYFSIQRSAAMRES